jgi:hypothetical protein
VVAVVVGGDAADGAVVAGVGGSGFGVDDLGALAAVELGDGWDDVERDPVGEGAGGH